MPLVPSYIESLEPYKPGGTIEEIQKRVGLDRIIKLASNENPYGPSPKAIQAMEKSIYDLHRYPDAGATALRSALAEKYKVKLDNIVVASGSEGIMSSIMRTFLMDQDEIVTSAGTFIGFKILAQASGKKTQYAPMKNYGFDLSAMVPLINQHTKIIYLCNPNNPTGTIFTKKEFDAFYKHVPERVLILLDEAYYEFAHQDKEYPDSQLYRYDNVITLRTFSKAHGLAGIRVGYGIAHDQLITNLMKIKLPFEPNHVAQVGALASLEDDQFIDHYVNTNHEGRELFYQLFSELKIPFIKSFANFVMIDCGDEEKANQIHQKILNKGIMIRPLKGFALPTCLRITTGTPEENALFVQAFKDGWKEIS